MMMGEVVEDKWRVIKNWVFEEVWYRKGVVVVGSVVSVRFFKGVGSGKERWMSQYTQGVGVD